MSKTEKTAAKAPTKALPFGSQAQANLPITSISIKDGFNPRLSLGDISELTENIRVQGIISPITVCPTGAGATSYYVIAGHRRFAAAQAAELVNIPAVIRSDLTIDSDDAYAYAISENSDIRTGLTDGEQARAFARLITNGGTAASVSKKTGYSHAHVRRTLKLLEIEDQVKEKLDRGEIGKGAAIATLDVPEEIRDQVIKKIGPGTTEADVHRMSNEAKRELKDDDVLDEDKPTAKAPSRHNVPVGQIAGERAIVRNIKDIRKKIEFVAVEALNAKLVDQDEAAYQRLADRLATLLWTVGSLESESPDTQAFEEHFAELRRRIEARMEARKSAKSDASGDEDTSEDAPQDSAPLEASGGDDGKPRAKKRKAVEVADEE